MLSNPQSLIWSRSIGFILIVVLIGIGRTVFAEEVGLVTSTPSVTPPINSLFSDDICSAPCWFGLTPGLSTTQDVINIFEVYSDLFVVNPEVASPPVLFTDNFDKLLEGENPTFLWEYWETGILPHEGWIRLTEGVVTAIDVVMNRKVSLSDVLNTYGQPSYVLVTTFISPRMTLFYLNQQIDISLEAPSATCNMMSFLEDFTVLDVYYYSPEISIEAFQSYYDGFPIVDTETWQQWQSEPDDISCENVLSEPRDSFTFVTSTPSPFSITSPLPTVTGTYSN